MMASVEEVPAPRAVPTLRASESFEDYYQRDYKKLLGLAFVLTGQQGVAEDLCQDALTEAHRNWRKIGNYDRPEAWVRRVMVNKSVSRSRRLKSEAKALLRFGSQPDRVVAPTERSLEVWEAVRALPQRQSQAIALHYWDDLPRAEIATILECSEETVKTHLKRGRVSLAETLEGFDPGGSDSTRPKKNSPS